MIDRRGSLWKVVPPFVFRVVVCPERVAVFSVCMIIFHFVGHVYCWRPCLADRHYLRRLDNSSHPLEHEEVHSELAHDQSFLFLNKPRTSQKKPAPSFVACWGESAYRCQPWILSVVSLTRKILLKHLRRLSRLVVFQPGVGKLQQAVQSALRLQLFWGVSWRLTSIPRHTGQRGEKCQCLLLLLAIQFHLHGIQNGSLPALGVAAPRVDEHWNITSSRHARIHVAIAREVDVWCNPVFPAQLPMSLHVGRCVPTRVSVLQGTPRIKQERTCRVPHVFTKESATTLDSKRPSADRESKRERERERET